MSQHQKNDENHISIACPECMSEMKITNVKWGAVLGVYAETISWTCKRCGCWLKESYSGETGKRIKQEAGTKQS